MSKMLVAAEALAASPLVILAVACVVVGFVYIVWTEVAEWQASRVHWRTGANAFTGMSEIACGRTPRRFRATNQPELVNCRRCRKDIRL